MRKSLSTRALDVNRFGCCTLTDMRLDYRYKSNAVESLNRSLRKIIKTRGNFPNDDAAMKPLYLAINNADINWKRTVAWTAAMSLFGDRFKASAS